MPTIAMTQMAKGSRNLVEFDFSFVIIDGTPYLILSIDLTRASSLRIALRARKKNTIATNGKHAAYAGFTSPARSTRPENAFTQNNAIQTSMSMMQSMQREA